MSMPFEKSTVLLAAYLSLLYVTLTPGIVLSIPQDASRLTQTLVHAVVYLIIVVLTYKPILNMISKM